MLLPSLAAAVLIALHAAGAPGGGESASSDGEPPSRGAEPAPRGADPKVLHVLNRAAYGPRPGDVERVLALGSEAWLARQLDYSSVPESLDLERRLAGLKALRMTELKLVEEYGPPEKGMFGGKPSREAKKRVKERAKEVLLEAVEARLLRAVMGERQLHEVMSDFWSNHFNVFGGKGVDTILLGAFVEHAVRPHALGRFRDLLGATARHPAMLFYLDNQQNTAPGSPGAKGKRKGLNENYARELLELHTLGVDGGYTQKDVIELARVLTGWGVERGGGKRRRRAPDPAGFRFDKGRHDFGPKTLLGRRLEAKGEAEGEEALDLLARHPSTARFIALKLARRFVADEPPRELVERLSARFRETDGDLRAVLKALFDSPEFWSPKALGAKFKDPFRYAVSAARALGVTDLDAKRVQGMLKVAGMPLYGCLTPDGYKDTRSAWLNPDAMMKRVSLAAALGQGRPLFGRPDDGDRDREPVDPAHVAAALGDPFSDATRAALREAPPRLRAGLMLGSPEFMRY